jgi:hypothetical protein
MNYQAFTNASLARCTMPCAAHGARAPAKRLRTPDDRISPRGDFLLACHQLSSLMQYSDVGAIGPFDQGSPLYNQISHWPPFGRLPENVDIQSDNL